VGWQLPNLSPASRLTWGGVKRMSQSSCSPFFRKQHTMCGAHARIHAPYYMANNVQSTTHHYFDEPQLWAELDAPFLVLHALQLVVARAVNAASTCSADKTYTSGLFLARVCP
jgi:hypothetical protein